MSKSFLGALWWSWKKVAENLEIVCWGVAWNVARESYSRSWKAGHHKQRSAGSFWLSLRGSTEATGKMENPKPSSNHHALLTPSQTMMRLPNQRHLLLTICYKAEASFQRGARISCTSVGGQHQPAERGETCKKHPAPGMRALCKPFLWQYVTQGEGEKGLRRESLKEKD